MVICHCERVSDRAVATAIDDGCGTVQAVAVATGAGRGCGCCVSSLRKMIVERLGQPRQQERPDAAA